MRVIPLSFAPFLSEYEVLHHECSDRIWVPQRTFERWLTTEEAGTVVTVLLGKIPACMYAPHTGPRNVIYAPTWICEELGVPLEPDMDETVDDYIVPERLQAPMCTFVRVQPHTSEHLPTCIGGSGGDAMPEETLSRAFEEYTCLREGQTLMLQLPSGDRMFVTIVDALPTGIPTGLCIRNTEVAMDLLEPLDRPEPPHGPLVPFTTDTEPAAPFTTDHATTTATSGNGPNSPNSPSYFNESREARRERIARAAMARFTQQQQ